MADRHQDLLTFRLMAELNQKVWEMTSTPPASLDEKFSANIRDASNSAERNVPEGFGRFAPGDFARFLDYSRASAEETKNQLLKGLKAGYFSRADYEEADTLAGRALSALAKFQRYLRSPRARRNAERIRERQNSPQKKEPLARNEPKEPNESNERKERDERDERNERNEPLEREGTSRTVRTSRTSRTTGPFE